MTNEAPEYRTKTLSPYSPVPVHPPIPPESANITVLQRQTDPIFNMTSTHLDPSNTVVAADSYPDAVVEPGSPSTHSNFSDAYNEQPDDVKQAEPTATHPTEDSDDYAMTFDSDADEQSSPQKSAQAIVEIDEKSLPIVSETQTIPSPQSASSAEASDINYIPLSGQNILPTHTPDSPSLAQPAIELPQPTASDASAVPPPAYPTNLPTHTYEDIASGGVDIQALLDNITANAEKNAEKNATSSATPTPTTSNAPFFGLPSHSSLPPRPNISQKRPFPNDIHKYHAGVQGPPPAATAFRANNSALVGAGAPGTSTDPRTALPPPPSVVFNVLGEATPTSGNIPSASHPQINRLAGAQNKSIGALDEADDLDAKWGPEVQKKYDAFLEKERRFVIEGLWDHFPAGSRLFIGNLPSEKVTKRDLFHVFHHHGEIAQISIKNAYGFVQYFLSEDCKEALKREQGSEVRGRAMHLEISKPAKPTRNNQATANKAQQPVRRPGSPEYSSRGGRGNGGDRGFDRNSGRGGPSMRTDEYGRPIRVRDDRRVFRSPSPPPRGGYRGRGDDYISRGRDEYDNRDRRRSRSRSPYGRMETRYRERSPSPRSREAMEDASLSIPRREPRDVPDVQIILLEQLDRQFVSWVESEMRGRGIKVEVMFLSPRLPLQAVIRRQIMEGVQAVSKLDLRSQNMSKVSLQLFDRSGGPSAIRFDEYQDLDPKIAAELVLRAKNDKSQVFNPPPFVPPQQPQYQPPPMQTYQPPPISAPAQAGNPNLSSVVGSLDNATLQMLLGTLTANAQVQAPSQPHLQMPPQQHNPPAAQGNAAIDLTNLLNNLQQNQQRGPPQQQQQYQVPAQYGAQNVNGQAGYGVPLSQQQQQQVGGSQSQQQQADVQNIMAHLAKYRQ